jgi:hypothetical protein
MNTQPRTFVFGSRKNHQSSPARQSSKQFSAWATVLIVLSASVAGLAQAVQPKLIDVHEHFNGEPGVLDRLLAKLNAADGIGILLVTPNGFDEAGKFIRQHPDRFIGFGDIKLDDPDVLNQIDRFHRAGFRGLGEITTPQKDYDDRAYWPIYDRAAKYHMILLFHTGIVDRLKPEVPADISFDRMRATRLDLIARHWPKTIVIGAHLGNPDYAEAAEIARWNPNLYFDLSGSSLIKKKDDSMTVIRQEDFISSVAGALQYISYYHPVDYITSLAKAYEREQSPAAKDAMAQILINSRMCAEGHRPICQDTGIVTAFVKVGMDVRFEPAPGEEPLKDLQQMVDEGVRRAYLDPDNKLRASIQADPAGARKNTKDNTPACVSRRTGQGRYRRSHRRGQGRRL